MPLKILGPIGPRAVGESVKELVHSSSEHLVDFSTYLLLRFTASLVPELVKHIQ
jgi:hypothetical protein